MLCTQSCFSFYHLSINYFMLKVTVHPVAVPSTQISSCVLYKTEACVCVLQGGVKVLITGPWLESSSEYSCLFDHISVPAALIQPGVLRCYCPGSVCTHSHTLLIMLSYMEKHFLLFLNLNLTSVFTSLISI